MRSKPVALLLADLGVTKTHSRPHVSNDNPCPQFPERFGSVQDGRAFAQSLFPWYNQAHRHSGLGFLTPAVVHVGQAAPVRAQRQQVLAAASPMTSQTARVRNEIIGSGTGNRTPI